MVVEKLICSYGGRKVENPYVLLASIKLNRLVQFFFKKINYIGTNKGFVQLFTGEQVWGFHE
jgi:hypothetical protein